MKAPGEELIGKLWVTLVDNGVGGLLRPWQIRREAQAKLEAKTKEVVAMAIAEKKAKDISQDNDGADGYIAGHDGRWLAEKSDPPIGKEGLSRLAEEIALAEFVRKERNTAKAIMVAERELLEFEGDVTEKDIDGDWIHRWRSLAGEVGAEKLQYLWGKVLAGEAKAPGQYSLRTLDFLKNLSQDEARKIESIAPFIISGRLIRGIEGFPEKFGVSQGVLLDLQSIGVLSSADSIAISASWNSIEEEEFIRPLVVGERVIIARHKDPKTFLKMPAVIVTEVGKQVLSLINYTPDETYLLAVSRKIKEKGFDVQMARVTRFDDDWLDYDDVVDVE